jgi:exodeoxyribonuclease VII small subunit
MTKQLKFEDAMKKLEAIVDEMEKGDINLDKSLENFEEGIKLVRFCSSKLEEAKKKIEILVKKGSKMEAEPFTQEEKNDSPSKKETNKKTDLFE